MEKKEIWIIALLALVVIGMVATAGPFTIQGYEKLAQIRSAVNGQTTNEPTYLIAANIYKTFDGAINKEALMLLVQLLQVSCAVISIVGIYALGRKFFGIKIAFIGTLLFVFCPIFVTKMSILNFSVSGIPLAALVLSFVLLAEENSIKKLLGGILLALPLYRLFLQTQSGISPDFWLFLFAPTTAVFFISIIQDWKNKKMTRQDIFVLGTVLISIIAGAIDPLLGLPGLTLTAFFALQKLESMDKRLLVGLGVFFLLLPLLVVAEDVYKAVGLSLIVGIGIGFISAFYHEEEHFGKYLVPLSMGVLLFSTINAGFQSKFVDAADEQLVQAMEWIRTNTPADASVVGFGSSGIIQFLGDRNSFDYDAELAKFLLTNKSASALKSAGIRYVVIDSVVFDDINALENAGGIMNSGIYSFEFGGGYYAESSGYYQVMLTKNREDVLSLPINQDGSLDSRRDAVVTINEQKNRVPFETLLILKNSNQTGLGKEDRIVYCKGSYDSNLIGVFFAEKSGIEKVYENGRIRIFEVKWMERKIGE